MSFHISFEFKWSPVTLPSLSRMSASSLTLPSMIKIISFVFMALSYFKANVLCSWIQYPPGSEDITGKNTGVGADLMSSEGKMHFFMCC